ncbi:hypothetical protein [Planomonospora algeriensis]
MVQPYLDMVEAEGETSLLYFGGRFSHAVRRNPMLAGGSAAPDADNARAEPRTPELDQLALAERVLAEAAGSPGVLYARVDLVRLPGGDPALIEVELAEPYLFLRYAPDGAADLARAVLEHLSV